MPKSTAQVLAEQQRGADRLRQPPSTAVTIPQAARSTALTVPTRTALNSYLDATAPSAFSGRLVKFSKEGKFVIADSGDAVDDTIDFVALCDEVLVGWLKFNGENTPPDRVQGLLYEGFALPPRETLGDLDQTKWEAGLTGAPEDPWLHQMNLVLQHGATGEIFTFSTTSKTGRRAIVDLLRHYNRLRQRRRSVSGRAAESFRLPAQACRVGRYAVVRDRRQGTEELGRQAGHVDRRRHE
jgi:hypothetical protein